MEVRKPGHRSWLKSASVSSRTPAPLEAEIEMRCFSLLLLAALSLAAADVAGKWTGTVEIPAGTFQVLLTLEQKGEEVSGTISAQGDPYPVQKGKISGNKLIFEVPADQMYAVECTLEKDTLMGDIKPSGGGSGKMRVTRSAT